jgi:predicted anti-sigma-YlaC factor YlaD
MNAREFGSRQCETSREWVSLRLDGELSELEEAMLRRHAAGCPECAAFAASAELFTAQLRSAPLETVGLIFEAEPTRVRRRFAAVGAAAAALAAAAAVLLAPGLGNKPSSAEFVYVGTGVSDVTFEAMRAGQRARMRLPESITNARIRVIELT